MKKIAVTLSLATLLLGGVVGCAADDKEGATGLAGRDQRGFGYHTTEQRQNTTITGQRTGEGPITDMFTDDDRRGARGFGRTARQPETNYTTNETGMGESSYGTRGLRSRNSGARNTAGYGDTVSNYSGMRNGKGRMESYGRRQAVDNEQRGNAGMVGNRPGYVDDQGILRDRIDNNRYSGLGKNKLRTTQRGFTNGTSNRLMPGTTRNNFTYHQDYDSGTVERYSTALDGIENVSDYRVIVNDNKVLVGVDGAKNNAQMIEKNIRQKLKGLNNNHEVIVITERDQFEKIRSADDRLRTGEAFDQVGSTINDMFTDFSRAIERPLGRTR